MRPTNTTYRLARPGGEYNALYAMMRRNGVPEQRLSWPVVVAERNDKLIGFLGTWDTANAIIAGPTVIDGGRNMVVYLRLAEAYDNVMRLARISSYVFTVAKSNSAHVERVKRVGIKQIGEDAEQVWFKREL